MYYAMDNIPYLLMARQSKHSEAMRSYGVFWAFSNQQFEENKTHLAEGDKYVSIGMGGYMPKSQVLGYQKALEEIATWFQTHVDALNLREAYILYELHNHEAFYVGEIEDTLAALGPNYTMQEVKDVYWKHYDPANV